MNQLDETESGGAYHRVDEDTGKPYWELWGEGWMDTEDMEPCKIIKLSPKHFPPGTRIVIIEPGPDTKEASEFYRSIIEHKKFYPMKVI